MTHEMALKLAADLLARADPAELAKLLLENESMDVQLHDLRNELHRFRLRAALKAEA